MSKVELCLQLARTGFSLDVNVQLPAEGITVLFGPSGSGKTTLLRCVAGLERAAGRVSIAGHYWQDDAARVFLPTWQRPLGYVFQEASLFEHLSVRGNLDFALKRGAGAGVVARASGGGAVGHANGRRLLEDTVALLGIGHLLDRHASGLSGGERQRVAIARALLTQPQVMLLDEPLASLDAARKQDILPWLLKLRDELRLPMLYVTHSADELARLADHLVVLEQGRVRASGPVQQVLTAVHSPVVVGDDAGALLHGQVQTIDAAWHLASVACAGGALWVRDAGFAAGQRLRVCVLARDVSLALQPPVGSSIQNQLVCRVDAIEPEAHPSQALVRLACGPDLLLARVTRRAVHDLALEVGQSVWAQVKSVAIVE